MHIIPNRNNHKNVSHYKIDFNSKLSMSEQNSGGGDKTKLMLPIKQYT